MFPKSCLGEVCQYLWVREITRTSSTKSVGLHTQQPRSTHCASAELTLPFVAQERNQQGSTGSGNRVVLRETKAASLLSPTQMNDSRIFLGMDNSMGFCSAFENWLFWVKRSFCLGNTNPAIQNKFLCVHCACFSVWFSFSSSIYGQAGNLFQIKLWVKWYVTTELIN